jgi:ketosteroid isomerase-like protein
MVTCAHDAAPRQRLVSDEAGVEAANARFYRAVEALDIEAMDRVWEHGERVRCVHPGWPLRRGWGAVRESWQRIFEHTQEMRFTLADVTVGVGLAASP